MIGAYPTAYLGSTRRSGIYRGPIHRKRLVYRSWESWKHRTSERVDEDAKRGQTLAPFWYDSPSARPETSYSSFSSASSSLSSSSSSSRNGSSPWWTYSSMRYGYERMPDGRKTSTRHSSSSSGSDSGYHSKAPTDAGNDSKRDDKKNQSSNYGVLQLGQSLGSRAQKVLSSMDMPEILHEPSSTWDSWDSESDAENSEESSHSGFSSPSPSASSNGVSTYLGVGNKPLYEGKSVYEALRIDKLGKSRRVYVRRRNLINTYGLQLRDLRRVDPSLSPMKTSPSISIKEDCVLINVGGVRALITADICLLFEPSSEASRKLVEVVTPRLIGTATDREKRKMVDKMSYAPSSQEYDSHSESSYYSEAGRIPDDVFPFELEILEAALMVATGRLESELYSVTTHAADVADKLPGQITPNNLDSLRRVKQRLVELESKAENLRDTLEELMEDEDEIIQLNLSSRPKREEKRRQREREKIEREMEREWAERGMRIVDGLPTTDPSLAAAAGLGTLGAGAASGLVSKAKYPQDNWKDSSSVDRNSENQQTITSEELRELNTGGLHMADTNKSDFGASKKENKASGNSGHNDPSFSASMMQVQRSSISKNPGTVTTSAGRSDIREEGAGDRYEDAQDALEEMIEEEEEERELEEVEDLLEYYFQRAATTQSEAERLLAVARDLEESIGVSLSARRFEVNRLELMLSMASFAAALGAMVASIFGMNLRSTLEASVIGFWGTTALIIAGSAWIFWIMYRYSKMKRIL